MKPRAILVLCAIASACADDDRACEPPAVLSGSTPLPQEVDAIFEQHCRECHTDPVQMFAPMPLLDWEDVQRPQGGEDGRPAVYSLVGDRINDGMYPMPPVTRAQLSGEERATLEAWIADCAPPAE